MNKKSVDLKPIIRFLKSLPESGDIELALLKCHLLIEEILTEIIVKASKNPQYISTARLSFMQKIHVARALSNLSHSVWVWESLKLLNSARNGLAHNLNAEKTTEKLSEFTKHVLKNNPIVSPEDEYDDEVVNERFTKFHWAAYATYTVLAVHAQFDPAKVRPITSISHLLE
ncbi:MAG: hypothetical protein JAY63_13085 [Candidatus Thiodiazotropha taylori]|nr:hypothetical protein [Candidatus Thiodiazotropha taylori]